MEKVKLGEFELSDRNLVIDDIKKNCRLRTEKGMCRAFVGIDCNYIHKSICFAAREAYALGVKEASISEPICMDEVKDE